MSIIGPQPVHRAKTSTILDIEATEAGSISQEFATDADSVLISLFAESVSGTLDVVVYTLTEEGKTLPVIIFPQLTAATSNLVIKKAAAIMSRLKVEAIYSDATAFEVRARGIGVGTTSVKILGANEGKSSQRDIGTTAESIIPSSLSDRVGIIVRNNSPTGTLYLGYTSAEASPGNGYPLEAGESLGIDLAAGAELFGEASSGTIDVRVMEASS